MVNRVTLIGHLGKDVELRYTPSGASVARFTMATSENRKDSQGNWVQDTTWHNVVIWGPAAERAAENLKKGYLVYVEGKISIRNWEDKEGNKRTNYEVVGFTCRNLSFKEAKEAKAATAPAAQPQAQPQMEDEDLPF